MSLAAPLLLLAALTAADDDLRVAREPIDGVSADQWLQTRWKQQVHAVLDKRQARYESRKTPQDWKQYQVEMRSFFRRQLGGLPDATPLRSQVVGKLEGADYRVEKILYESRPGHHVSAALYLPNGPPPYPAVLIACGHTKTGKAAEYNQRIGILLARHGLAAFCYDPIGQGERSQLLTEDGKEKHASSTREHSLVGIGSILLGVNTAQYRIHDGIRGIDYLVSRKDIDADKIGCTGCSGGGTLTSYIMALDERVRCAAPACYLTSFRNLVDSLGPQDAEQNVFGQLAGGLDHADYVLMRAPRPTLICCTTSDYFDVRGTWQTFREAKRVYTRFGFPERVDLVEVAGRHGIPPETRAAMTQWMRRWLLGKDGPPIREDDFPVWTVEQLQCTPRGQVLLMDKERSVFDLNRELYRQLAGQRDAFWRKASEDEARKKIRELAGIRRIDALPPVTMRPQGQITRDGYRIEKQLLQGGELLIPMLKMAPGKTTEKKEAGDPVVLYVSEQGKQAAAAVGGPLEKLVRHGKTVYAVDVRGFGELAGKGDDAVLGDWKTYYLGYLLGQSLVGVQAEDLLAATRQIARFHPDSRPRVIAEGRAGLAALHAVAVEPQAFSGLETRGTLAAWSHVLDVDEPVKQLTGTVHGALRYYDLPHLVRLAGPQRTRLRDPVDATDQPLPLGP